jgi:hypothetical protein
MQKEIKAEEAEEREEQMYVDSLEILFQEMDKLNDALLEHCNKEKKNR